jgi:rSAM/selenodomain-associated transferase 1
MQTGILIFAKAPRPGTVKTRLKPMLGYRGAADFYSKLLKYTLNKAVNSGIGPVECWCTPDCKHPVFQSIKRKYRVTMHRQKGRDLGYRMLNAIRSSLRVCDSVLLVGSDVPELPVSYLNDARRLLQGGYDVVLGPALDGGYVLIGMKKPIPSLFINMPWGSRFILPITRKKLTRMGLNFHELPAIPDVDTPADVRRLNRSGFRYSSA